MNKVLIAISFQVVAFVAIAQTNPVRCGRGSQGIVYRRGEGGIVL